MSLDTYPPPDTDLTEYDRLVIADVPAQADADKINADSDARKFMPCPIGVHELVVNKFFGSPEDKSLNGWLGGQYVQWQCKQVCVELAKADQPNATVLYWLLLPPTDSRQWDAYWGATNNEGDSQGGLEARKFVQFINAIGFPWAYGAKFPAEAQSLKSWLKRRCVGDVIPHYQGKLNKSGEPLTQIKLFGLRPIGSPMPGAGRPAPPGSRQPAPPPPTLGADDL